MWNGKPKVNENYLSKRMRLYGNFKPKSSMPISPDPDSLIEETKRVYLQCCV